MKILLLSNKVPYPANDGSSIAVSSMIDGFLKNGAQVTLLSLNTRKHYKPAGETGKAKPKGLEIHTVQADTNIDPVSALTNLIGGKPYHTSRFFVKEFQTRLISLLQEGSFDIIQMEGLPMGVYLETIRKYSQAQVSLRAHNVEHLIWERHLKTEKNFLRKAYLKIQVRRLREFEKHICASADAVIPITSTDEQHFVKMTRVQKSRAIPCGVDLAKYAPCPDPPLLDIVYLASFDWMPNVQGLEWFIEKVWPHILKLRPQSQFTLAGRKMPVHIRRLNRPGIEVTGEAKSMREFICRGKVVVVPLLAGSGMRIKIIENMALGKAMVSTVVGAEGIAACNGKNIFLEDNPLTFAKAVVKLLDHDDVRSAVERSARATAEKHYNNQVLGKDLLAFYRDL